MVVAANGRMDKSEYRRFKVKLKDKPDDVGMMREVLSRRFKREKSKSKSIKKWGRPDLIVVDGGKAQVSTAMEVMKGVGFRVPVIGLAKKEETVVYKYKDRYTNLRLPKDSQGLKLLMVLRDEAHRFAQKYHHYLRKRKITSK
jgi:excinuclease ABC subunit C